MSYLSLTQSEFKKDLVLTRCLELTDYEITIKETYKYFKVSDPVVCFYNGKEWLLILLDDMLAYPVLYFDFWSEKDNTTYKNSLLVCPITLRAMIYKGLIKITDIINDRLYLINTDTDDEFFMDTPYTGHYDKNGTEKKIKSHVKRHEVKILTLRDAFLFVLDPKYIVISEPLKMRPIVYEKYYLNRLNCIGQPIHTSFHPKTIVYMIQYYSHSTNGYRYTVIIGRDINKETITGYNYKLSGLWEFMRKHAEKFAEKRAYIYPVFWYMVEKLYKDVKMILIS